MLENTHLDERLSIGSLHDRCGVLLKRHRSIFRHDSAYVLKNHNFDIYLLRNLA